MQYEVSGASSMHGAETALENSCSLNVKEILLAVAHTTQKSIILLLLNTVGVDATLCSLFGYRTLRKSAD